MVGDHTGILGAVAFCGPSLVFVFSLSSSLVLLKHRTVGHKEQVSLPGKGAGMGTGDGAKHNSGERKHLSP